MDNLTPLETVKLLDKYIVGQAQAKRAVAIALRNRYRRKMLPEEQAREITPKNILMIGPTGVGKTEIARRVARLIDAPFIKVEATKFTEVGYVGRDVESMIHELVDTSFNLLQEKRLAAVLSEAEERANARLIEYLARQDAKGPKKAKKARLAQASNSTASAQAQQTVSASGHSAQSTSLEATGIEGHSREAQTSNASSDQKAEPETTIDPRTRKRLASRLARQELEDTLVEIELSNELILDSVFEFVPTGGNAPDEANETVGELLQGFGSFPKTRQRKVAVKEARKLLSREEAGKLIDWEGLAEDALKSCEESAVVFIDELDKIVGPRIETGSDISGEGVQRDLLPIVEGTTVITRFGPIKTDHILFIAAGAFYSHKPSDLLPELQGRFPLRVELSSLSQADFVRILKEPENALTKQYQALLATEGIDLVFTEDGVARIAEISFSVNERMQNIGARRLQTVIERVLEEISFDAPELVKKARDAASAESDTVTPSDAAATAEPSNERITVTVDADYVNTRLGDLLKDEDLTRYIL